MSTIPLLVSMLVAGAAGLILQGYSWSDRAREVLWNSNYVILLPAASAYAFLTIELGAGLVAVIACGIAAWWMTIGVSWLAARGSGADRAERGALTLIGGFPNTGFIGFPLANLAFGTDGLRLAIIYDQVSLVVPAIVVATLIAQRHSQSAATSAPPSIIRLIAKSPPVWFVLIFATIRLLVLHEPIQLEWLGSLLGIIVGPIGFLLLGLSLPLHGFTHKRTEVARVAWVSAVRVLAAPALLWLVARITGTDMPTAMYLVAAMPTAFHTLVISRIHTMAPAVVRLGVLMTTTVVVSGTILVTLLGNGS